MKHADDRALDQLTDLLTVLRTIDGLKEKKRGIFYRKGQAFLHFHEDPTGLFADLRSTSDWERFPVNTPEEQAQFLERLELDTEVLRAFKGLQLKTEPSTAG
ncbi:MAG: hypothetical protein ACAF41_20580 [Leptolyngbya sp. BL-A-14]